MARTVRSLLASSLLVCAFLGTGCLQTCQRACVENARYVDGCLEHWEALWADFGYENADGYIATCQLRVEQVMGGLDLERQRGVREVCADNLSDVVHAIGCSDYPEGSAGGLDPTENDNGVIPRPQGDNSGG